MFIKINCIENDSGCWCRNENIKRSLFGLGARMCLVYEGKRCEFQEKYPRPGPPPPKGGTGESKKKGGHLNDI